VTQPIVSVPPPVLHAGGVIDLLGLGIPAVPVPAPVPDLTVNNSLQRVAPPSAPVQLTPPAPKLPFQVKPSMALVSPADNPGAPGLKVEAVFVMHDNQVKLRMILTNQSDVVLDRFLIKFGANTYKAFPSVQQLQVQPINPGGQGKVSVPLVFGKIDKEETDIAITIGLKSALGVSTFDVPLPIHTCMIGGGPLSRPAYKEQWEAFNNLKYFPLAGLNGDVNSLKQQLETFNIFFIAQRTNGSSTLLYLSATMADETVVLFEIELSPSGIQLCINTSQDSYTPLLFQSINAILRFSE